MIRFRHVVYGTSKARSIVNCVRMIAVHEPNAFDRLILLNLLKNADGRFVGLHFFCNFAVPFTKSGEFMTAFYIVIHEPIAHVQNFAFKENWKSTAGETPAQI